MCRPAGTPADDASGEGFDDEYQGSVGSPHRTLINLRSA
jgi:hypothetical protein